MMDKSLNLIPGSGKEFSSGEYWNKFFKIRGTQAFEWLARFPLGPAIRIGILIINVHFCFFDLYHKGTESMNTFANAFTSTARAPIKF